MKNISKAICTVLICVMVGNSASAQPDTVKQKDEAQEKTATKTGDVTKDLNAQEREKFNTIDAKKQNVSNPNYTFKKIDTSNLEMFSTKPVIKGSTPSKSKTPEKPVKTPVEKPVVKETVVKPIPSPAADTLKKAVVVKKTPEKKAVEKVEKKDDFSTQPIVKGKKISTESPAAATSAAPKKYSIDTTKDFKKFTFETTPVVGNNASYSRRDEPMPKSKQQIDEEIPVNRKPNNANVGKDDAFLKETYAQYTKEADSMHTANKRVLDSIMKSLNIKVPVIINPTEYIDIYVNGGGVLSGNDSKIYDRISILHTGVVQREYKTKNDGVQRSEKKISRDELTKLAQYIVDMDFFEFKDDYDCADNDAACNGRLSTAPQPVAMNVAVTVGSRKNKVNVALFAPRTEKNWVNYPATMEKIMNAIYTIVEK